MSWVSRFTADKKYPVTQTLFDIFYKDHKGGRASTGSRVSKKDHYVADLRNDVVSESLCDDTIKYLAPTLEQHKGCTIIDIHPGASVWSSKLHDFLQPKRHLLMEPEEKYFQPFIKPLLEKPGSTYRHTTLVGAHPREFWNNYEKVLGDPELAPMTALPKDDPALRKLDPTLLVIGNLARQYKVHHRNKPVSFGTLVLQQFGYAGLANELFHKGGLVRMLLWLPAAEKYTLLPISEMHRRSMNARLSVGSTITETVGSLDLYNADSTFYARRRQRAPVVEAVLADRAQRWMHDHGMQRPTGRPFLYNRLEADASEEVLSPFETTVSTWRELEAEIDTAEARFGAISSVSLPRSKERRSEDQKQQVEATLLGGMKYPQCGPASTTYHETGLRTPWLAVFADMGLRIMNLEVALCVVEEKAGAGADYKRARDRILELDADLEACILQRQIMLNLLSQQIVDQQQACLMEPPLMAIDARNYEPLKAAPDEFWPKNEIMLLDVVPKSRDLSVPDLASKGETARLCEALLKGLLESSSRFLPESLERVAPNAARDLLPLVPAARDPRKGGRLNPNRIRVRMISEDVIVDLLRAWMEWPFKPSMTDLELASESEEASEVTEGED